MMTMMTDEVMADGATMALDTETCRPVSGGPYPVLPYRVAECSSYSAGYRPELVCEDRPTDQASRWSSATNDQHQFITLRLEQPALLGIPLGREGGWNKLSAPHTHISLLYYPLCSSHDNVWQVSQKSRLQYERIQSIRACHE